MVVIGCSTSEVVGSKIGTNSNVEVPAAVFSGLYDYAQSKGLWRWRRSGQMRAWISA